MRFVLIRRTTSDEGTFGDLLAVTPQGTERVCSVAELPYRNNQRGLSCIPAGKYAVTYLPRSASGKYKDVYHVQDVEGRSGILIHKGNYVGDSRKGYLADSWGCLLPITRVGTLAGQKAGLASSSAMRKLHSKTERSDFTLEIIDV